MNEGHRMVQLLNGMWLSVPRANPEWYDDIIRDSAIPEEAAARIRKESERLANERLWQ